MTEEERAKRLEAARTWARRTFTDPRSLEAAMHVVHSLEELDRVTAERDSAREMAQEIAGRLWLAGDERDAAIARAEKAEATLFEAQQALLREGQERDAAREHLAVIVSVVNEQAEDEGLWFRAETAPEAYLQRELRRLHAATEGER